MAEEPRIETVGAMLVSSRLRALLRYWNEKRGERAMPARGDIDPVEIPRLLPVTLIADAASGQSCIRLLGSETTNAYGRELRGLPVDDVEFGDFTPRWRDAFVRVAATMAPVATAGTFHNAAGPCEVELVLMPLAAGGGSIIEIFGGLVIRPVSGAVRSGDEPIRGWRVVTAQDFRAAESRGG